MVFGRHPRRSVMVSKSSNPDSKVLRYVQFYAGRTHNRTEEQIAHGLDFGSPVALYQQLSQDGFPVCPVCGETPAKLNHCTKKKGQRQRRARRGTAQAIESVEQARRDRYLDKTRAPAGGSGRSCLPSSHDSDTNSPTARLQVCSQPCAYRHLPPPASARKESFPALLAPRSMGSTGEPDIGHVARFSGRW